MAEALLNAAFSSDLTVLTSANAQLVSIFSVRFKCIADWLCRITSTEAEITKHAIDDEKETLLPEDVALAWQEDWTLQQLEQALNLKRAKVSFVCFCGL